jgi:murein L,D-transpeptidase YafK
MQRRLGVLASIVVLAATGAWLAYGRADAPTAIEPQVAADLVVVRKARRELTLYRDGEPLKTYRIALGRGEPGRKRREGDGRLPEGRYRISGRDPDGPNHRQLAISYPSPSDVETAEARGDKPGGDVTIHGIRDGFGWLGPLHRLVDWTEGSVAVTDGEIEEIWLAVANNTLVVIEP